MSTTTKILVVGGGIGGLAAAIALSDSGKDVRVAEIMPDLHSSTNGVGIVQPFNALVALDAIGCADRCMELGYPARRWGRMLDAQGNLIRDIQGATPEGSRFPRVNGITRPLLHKILTERALEVGTTITYGTTVKDFTQSDDDLLVVFDDGSSETFELVIGADGVNSKVRELIFGDRIQPAKNGLSSFRVNIPRKIPGEMEIDGVIRQEGLEGMVGYVPLAEDLAYAFYNFAWDPDRRLSQDEAAAVLKKQLAPYGGLAARVRDDYLDDPEQIVVRPQEWLIADLPWHKGRVVLMGDAVHAVTPHLAQGAALAIEDGIVLARVLEEKSSVLDAVREFGERRYERCKFIVEASQQIGQWELDADEAADIGGLTQKALERMLEPI